MGLKVTLLQLPDILAGASDGAYTPCADGLLQTCNCSLSGLGRSEAELRRFSFLVARFSITMTIAGRLLRRVPGITGKILTVSGLLFAWKLVYYHGHTRNHGMAIGAGFGFRWQNYNGF